METHFKLTGKSKVNNWGVTLFRVQLTKDCKWGKAGDLGGWIEKEKNLSGEAWVADEAEIFGEAVISGQAWISEHSRVFGQARVSGQAAISGNAAIFGEAEVSGQAAISGEAEVYGQTRVFERSIIFGQSMIFDHAVISGQAMVYGDSVISGQAEVCENARCTKKVFNSNFVYNLTLTDNHIRFGRVQKTVQEWIDLLALGEVIDIKKDIPEFKLIEMALNLAIEQWKQNQ